MSAGRTWTAPERVRRSRVGAVALALAAAACGGGNGDGSTTTPDPAPTTTTTVADPTSTRPPPTEPVPATSPLPTTPPTTPATTVPATSSSVETSAPPPAGDAVTYGPPDPSLLPSSPPEAIPWHEVGPGWVLLDHVDGYRYTVPVDLDRRGLYLVSPDDVVYAASALPTDGSWVDTVSADGRFALVAAFDPVCADGCECPGGTPITVETDLPAQVDPQMRVGGFRLLDLRTATARSVVEPVSVPVCEPAGFTRTVDLTADGSGVWVVETWWDVERRPEHARLSRVGIATGVWTTIVDEAVGSDDSTLPGAGALGVVELQDGRIVTSTRAGVRLRSPDGTPIRELAGPSAPCEVLRAWDAGHVLARCTVPPDAFPTPPEVPAGECHTNGLWSIPLDGSGGRPLAVSLDDRGYLTCWSGYSDAAPLDGWLAVQVGGDGCSDDVALISPGGEVARWVPSDVPDTCTERLLGVRDGAWLIEAWRESDPTAAVFEVTGEGSTRADLPPGDLVVL